MLSRFIIKRVAIRDVISPPPLDPFGWLALHYLAMYFRAVALLPARQFARQFYGSRA